MPVPYGYELTGVMLWGACPNCGHLETPKIGFHGGSLTDHLAAGNSFYCHKCKTLVDPHGKRGYWKPGRGKLSEYYKRERQFKAVNSEYVDYGALKRLEEVSGKSFGNMWRGDFDDLASHVSMTPEDAAEQWPVRPALGRKPTVDELRSMGVIEVSL